MATGATPKRRVQVASDIEKNRQEGNWTRCLELTSQLSSDQKQLFQFLTGEAKLEKFLQNCEDLPVPTGPHKDPLSLHMIHIQSKGPHEPEFIDDESETNRETLLAEAKDHLEQCLSSCANSPLSIDTNLLLAKVYYVSGQYSRALQHIEDSGIEKVTQVEKSLPLRVMKLVAESFAVKGMCLEKESSHDTDNQDSVKTTCLTKSTELAIRYLQNLEKMTGPYQIIQLGNILDTAIQKAPMLFVQSGQIMSAVNAYRSFMNAQEIASTLNLRQFMSRQFAETLIRGVSKSAWPPFDLSLTSFTGPWKPNRYIGQSLFAPKEREEEIILLLLISESLAARNVVLERSPEFAESRAASLSAVTAIYDLLTITLTPVKYFYHDPFERAMKFCYKVKHVWFQFALTLIKSKEAPERAVKLLIEAAEMDSSDPIPLMFAARQCIEELEDPPTGLQHAMGAFDRVERSTAEKGDKTLDSVKSRAALLVGIAHSVLFESAHDGLSKQNSHHLDSAVKYLKIAMKCNPTDHLPLMHMSLLMASQRLIKQAFQYAQAALTLNPIHLPTIKLVILLLSSLKQYNDALEVVEAALQEYPDHLILLYIKCHLTELVVSRSATMAVAKHMLYVWKNISSDESLVKSSSQYYHRGSILTTGSNLDNVSLKMEITLSEVMSIDSAAGMALTASAISPSITISAGGGGGGPTGSVMAGLDKVDLHVTSSSKSSKHHTTMFNIHLHIWLLIIELFIKLDQLDQAESAIFEGANSLFGPFSHQMMYVKGLLAKAKGNLDEARTYLQNAVSINPLHCKALQQLAHVYHLLDNNLVAEKYIRDSLKIDATVHESWSYFGLILDALGDHLHACNCQKTALQLESTAPILTFSLIPRAVFD